MKANHSLLILLIILLIPVYSVSGQKHPKKITISGTVTDANSNPIRGALILIDNNRTDCKSDENGYFKLKVKPEARLIAVFTMSNGMAEAEIAGRTTIDFIMGSSASTETQNKSVEEKVNTGNGTKEKKDLNTSAEKIDGQNMKYASYTNIFDLIRGEVSGVMVTGNKIVIQGVSTFSSGTDPLLIVNGIIVSSIVDIRPQNVKSIEILKGPAAAIYGSRGSNGVILITLMGSH